MAKPIISFVSLLLSLLFAFFYVLPAYNLSVERRRDIESLSKILNTSGEIKTLISKTKENLNNIDAEVLARFNVFLPEKIDAVRLANNLQNIGFKNRIILSAINVDASQAGGEKINTAGSSTSAPQGLINVISLGAQINKVQGKATDFSAVTTGKYVTTKASFNFVSSYETFQLFLGDLEKSLGLLNVTSLSFSPVYESTDSKISKVASSPFYQFVMSIETYSLQ